MVPDLLWMGIVIGVATAVGLTVGMLAAPALTRWSERADRDEEPGDGDD
jgi:hypothetical protein